MLKRRLSSNKILPTLDVFCKLNKLNECLNVLKNGNIDLNVIIGYNVYKLNDICKSLKLDVIYRARFIKGIISLKKQYPIIYNNAKLKETNNNNNKKVIITMKEHNAITSLYNNFDTTSQLKLNIENKLNNFNKIEMDTIQDINVKFDDVMKSVLKRKEQILNEIDELRKQKEYILQTQYKKLTKYQKEMNDANTKITQLTNQGSTSYQRTKLAQSTLNSRNYIPAMLTNNEMKFEISNKSMEKELIKKCFFIDEFDIPNGLYISIYIFVY